MKITILEAEERRMKFILEDATPGKANALRRALLADVPKMAIDKVDFNLGTLEMDGKVGDSKSPLFDEVVAHRLGMIPIPTDYSLFTFPEECACGGEGCPSCRISYNLAKVGPCSVMSSDLICLGDDKLAPVEKSIPIIELAKGQSIMLMAHAVMGTAAKHAKWQAVNAAGMKYKPSVKITGSISGEKAQKIADSCPKKVFEVKDGNLAVIPEREIECSQCNTCVEKQFVKEPITVTGDDKNFVFSFETDGSVTAQQALDKAVEVLSDKFKKLAEQISAF